MNNCCQHTWLRHSTGTSPCTNGEDEDMGSTNDSTKMSQLIHQRVIDQELLAPVSRINLARNNVQLLTPLLSPYLNTDSLFIHEFPSFNQQSSSKQPSAHSLQSSCPTQMPLDLHLKILGLRNG